MRARPLYTADLLYDVFFFKKAVDSVQFGHYSNPMHNATDEGKGNETQGKEEHEMSRYKAKKLCAGSYLYRGFKLDLVGGEDTDPYWRVEWPSGVCEDAETTLRDARRRADRYHMYAAADNSGLPPRDVESLRAIQRREQATRGIELNQGKETEK